jgi:hypothetical protein
VRIGHCKGGSFGSKKLASGRRYSWKDFLAATDRLASFLPLIFYKLRIILSVFLVALGVALRESGVGYEMTLRESGVKT